MTLEISEALWLDAQQTYTLDEVSAQSGLPGDLLLQLVDFEILPVHDAVTMTFTLMGLDVARTACRLYRDLELDAAALSLVMRLLARISDLETENRALQNHTPQFLR